MTADPPEKSKTPFWLLAFCYALMGPACAINAVFISFAIPGYGAYGIPGMLVAAAIGAAIGILPTLWLSRRIHEGIREDL